MDSHFDKLNTALKGSITSFVEKAFEAKLMSRSPSRPKKFTSVYDEIKAGLQSTNSAEEVQTHYQSLLKILDDLGGPAAVVGKSIATQLSTLTGKIYMYISKMGTKSFPPDRSKWWLSPH